MARHYYADCPKARDEEHPVWSDDPTRASCMVCLYQAKIRGAK